MQKNDITVTIPSTADEVQKIQNRIQTFLKRHHFSQDELFAIRLALEEALVNALRHGNHMDSSNYIRITWRTTKKLFEASIEDEGEGFDQTAVPDPTADTNLEKSTGRGLLLMRYYMDEVEFNEKGNSVTMRKYRT